MKAYEVAALVAIAVLIILFFHLATAKGEKRRITLINSEGGRLDVEVEVANEGATMAKGLMGRKSLAENEGMLFVFPHSGIYPFWMVNTTIPLDAIHIAENGTVVDVLEMEPCGLNVTKCRLYIPKAAAKYVLEVNRGYSKKNLILKGNSSLDLKSLTTPK
jgi:uncharacterized membrane protein (UPF0127 family)